LDYLPPKFSSKHKRRSRIRNPRHILFNKESVDGIPTKC
jgi:hypothetical protein